MSIKKNFFFSSFLTVSNFLFPFLTFPYVSRVLGVSNIGIVNWVSGIVQYFILFSMMGIGIVGIREVAKHKNDPIKLDNTFTLLFIFTAITTIAALLALYFFIEFVPQFKTYKFLFYIGAANVLVNLFSVEWFFKGIENFKFITIRSIIVKVLYVVSIFLFVKGKDNYTIYYSLTVAAVAINALFNWVYCKSIVKFRITETELKPLIRPFFVLGLYILFNSMYVTFNVAYLGFVGGNKEVGYYTTATKLYGIILAIFSAFTGVMMPRISSLVAEKKYLEINSLIDKSFDILYSISFPLIIFITVFAPEIIMVIAGPGYEGAILPMRIVMPLMLIIGTEEILIVQLLMPLNKDKAIFINSLIGAIVGITLAVLLIRKYGSAGSSMVWVFSEISILISANYFTKKYINIKIPYNKVWKNLLYSIPYVFIVYIGFILKMPMYFALTIIPFCFVLYFLVLQIIILKNSVFLNVFNSLKR